VHDNITLTIHKPAAITWSIAALDYWSCIWLLSRLFPQTQARISRGFRSQSHAFPIILLPVQQFGQIAGNRLMHPTLDAGTRTTAPLCHVLCAKRSSSELRDDESAQVSRSNRRSESPCSIKRRLSFDTLEAREHRSQF